MVAYSQTGVSANHRFFEHDYVWIKHKTFDELYLIKNIFPYLQFTYWNLQTAKWQGEFVNITCVKSKVNNQN